MIAGLAGVVLAAGRGTRFGGGKLLAHLADGRTMLEASVAAMAAARAATSCIQSITIVIRREPVLLAEAHRLASLHEVEIVINENADDGMASSIASGVAVTREATGWLIGLADMPFVTAATVAAVAQGLAAPADIVLPASAGRRGHPVLFGRAYYNALLALVGDAGAKALLGQHAASVREIAVEDAGIFKDIDTRDAMSI